MADPSAAGTLPERLFAPFAIDRSPFQSSIAVARLMRPATVKPVGVSRRYAAGVSTLAQAGECAAAAATRPPLPVWRDDSTGEDRSRPRATETLRSASESGGHGSC